ncbi:DUF4153 domain-containing protein [Tsuneonella sp. YG55]|uniref:DUF4153 domain-containing protein n=1 Tax=Tsuneonella litorea TaxID=2976475 RepID=A0A9X2W0X4_9SPHN|nr:DUF4153 domain-containing protein [Tsuneonella litorea]MCT2559002.1 DUF4153 domain-containing protein [Tsuneonella litorea]
MTEADTQSRDWSQLPWLLAATGLVAGLLIDLVGGGEGPGTKVGWQAAASALFFFAPVAFGFTVERDRWKEPLAFAAIVGLVMAGLAWRAVGAGDAIADPEYGFLAGLIATGLALPLFQCDFHRTRWATPYERVHRNVWNDAICGAGSLAFLGASWLLLLLLSELFQLLKVDFLEELLREGWFGWSFSGAAFGAALGTLRNEIGIIGTLRNVVMVVLSILAVPLAAGLAVFLVAMIVSGPDVLWEATRRATPILLLCAAGAWVLANAILREGDAAMSGNRVLRVAGQALALSILPLTVFAAISMGTRIAQHGLSPERLWGLVAIAVATAYGLAWFVAVMRGWRGDWQGNLRRANLHLAVLISGVALLLALPILDFGAIAARQQLARLDSGAVAVDKFDFDALQTRFGAAGRKAVAKLAKSSNPAIEKRARLAIRDAKLIEEHRARARIDPDAPVEVDFRFDDPELRAKVNEQVGRQRWFCRGGCVALDLGSDGATRQVALVAGDGVHRLALDPSGKELTPPPPLPPAQIRDISSAKVEVRERTLRQIYVDGAPVGEPFE